MTLKTYSLSLKERVCKIEAQDSQRNVKLQMAELLREREWSGGAMVLGKLPVPGRPTIWIQ